MSKKKRRATNRPQARAEEFNPDYTEVKRDLKRIGILAITFISILVILSLFQDQLLAIFIH